MEEATYDSQRRLFRDVDHRHRCGWIAEKVTASDHGLLTNLLVGIAGAFVGGWLAQLMNFQFEGWLGTLLVAAVGAVLVLWLWRFATGYRSA